MSNILLPRLVHKELNEVLRDRRTIVTLVLMPLLLYPLLGLALRTFLLGNLTPERTVEYHLGLPPGSQGAFITSCLRDGQEALAEYRKTERTTGETGSSRRVNPELRLHECADLEKAVLQGQVHVAIRTYQVPSLALPARASDVKQSINWELLYLEDSSRGAEAVRYLEELCAAENARVLHRRLVAIRRDEAALPLRPRAVALSNPEARKTGLLPGLVPLILILMTITGAVYPAIDATAGERERGTLEILAAAPVARLRVLLAKYVAVLTVAVLTALINLGTMTATLYLSGIGEVMFGPEALTPLVLAEVLGLLLLFASFFSALLLALTSFARSFKEAQAYLVPLMLLALMPGILSLVPGLQLRGALALVPLLNIALLTRDLLEGGAEPLSAVAVVSATALYALLALALAARIFAAEGVLYGQAGAWGDVFRHRRRHLR